MDAKELDQFYTKPKVAVNCVKKLYKIIKNCNQFSSMLNNLMIVEPSAGTGVFLNPTRRIFKTGNTLAFDIDPQNIYTLKQNFLSLDMTGLDFNVLTIGNPPFGRKSSLAIDFFNKAASFSKTIAFILPIQFQKYSAQCKLNKQFKLIHSEVLPYESFVFKTKSYAVRCVFQIWTTLETSYNNLRIITPPPNKHEDFEMYQYNNTPTALKFFNYDWDFAVPRQGFYDYKKRIVDKTELNPKVQYIFFKTNNEGVLNKLKNLNFEELSKLNTTTPGFGKADVVSYYNNDPIPIITTIINTGPVKLCTRCGEEKTYDHFHKDKTMSLGLYSMCKECKYKTSKERKKIVN